MLTKSAGKPIVWLTMLCFVIALVMPGCKSPWERVSKLNVSLVAQSDTGMKILVCPRDAKGSLVPITGSLDVVLWVYDNPRGCGMCDRTLKQEWLEIQLSPESYEPGAGAYVDLEYDNFNPGANVTCALGLTLTQEGRNILCESDAWDIGTEVLSEPGL